MMIADPPIRQRRLRRPVFTPTRITLSIFLGLFCLISVPLLARNVFLFGYLVLVLVTCVMVRMTRRVPGAWLRRRSVRRALVALIAATCVGLMASPSYTGVRDPAPSDELALLLLLIVLNVSLGTATQRVATALDTTVDERQEAMRNRAHRIAYAIFAVVVGGTVVVADVASQQTRSWLGSTAGGGGVIVFLELLFVLPAMVMAFLEPGYPAVDVREQEGDRSHGRRTRTAMALLALTVAIPVVLSLAVAVLPPSTSTTLAATTDGSGSGATACREFYANSHVGLGIEATLPIHARVCWNGKRAFETFGMNSSDCEQSSSVLTTATTTQCARTNAADGTLAFTFRADVASNLIPFVHRDVTLRLVIDRNGDVEQFP
jgi:hypothetical protein